MVYLETVLEEEGGEGFPLVIGPKISLVNFKVFSTCDYLQRLCKVLLGQSRFFL